MSEAPQRILIVDDSPEDREVYRRLLHQDPAERYELLETELGEEGLRLARTEAPDCLLLDYRLPDVDGLEFLSRLRADRAGPLVPVIVLTGQGNEAVAVEAMKGGAQDYLLKGAITRQTLQKAVQNAIEKVALQNAVEASTAELARANSELQGMYNNLEALVRRRTAELSRAKQQAEEANRMKDEFLATLSHELRTPLNAILGWAQVLRMGKLDEAASARALETIERNARAQAQLIADLLDVSRIITGKLRLDFQPVELRRIVEAALDSVRPAADAKGIRLGVTLGPLASPVLGDSDRLQQVVWNLLSNAIKFTPREGAVEVGLCQSGASAEVRVSDTGAGIRPDFLPYVFDRFRQAEGAITRTHGGLGLGLSIVRHLVELHGGTVEVESEGEGKGASFTVCLPVRTALSGSQAGVIAGEPQLVEGMETWAVPWGDQELLRGLRVLVVEDEDDTRELLVTALEQCGAEVAAAASVAAALEQLDEQVPDVLVSDLAMPVADGYSLIRQVRARPSERGGQVPAAALTAYARAEDRARALAAGFQMHVPKPIDPSALVRMVANLAARAGRV
ncbi:MAG TPA: response regulator [Thermoanaerobaculia bacterium]|jgi:signal transduction histidine kinase|nr:response regulator [Thermoanaerobaculia bacterium]